LCWCIRSLFDKTLISLENPATIYWWFIIVKNYFYEVYYFFLYMNLFYDRTLISRWNPTIKFPSLNSAADRAELTLIRCSGGEDDAPGDRDENATQQQGGGGHRLATDAILQGDDQQAGRQNRGGAQREHHKWRNAKALNVSRYGIVAQGDDHAARVVGVRN